MSVVHKEEENEINPRGELRALAVDLRTSALQLQQGIPSPFFFIFFFFFSFDVCSKKMREMDQQQKPCNAVVIEIVPESFDRSATLSHAWLPSAFVWGHSHLAPATIVVFLGHTKCVRFDECRVSILRQAFARSIFALWISKGACRKKGRASLF